MFIKRKHLIVAVFSSVIVSIVLFSTLFGYTLYIQWKKDSYILRYNSSIYKITAQLFRKDIDVANVQVRIKEEKPYYGLPVVEGTIKNNTGKTLTSMTMKISFSAPNGYVYYNDWVHPLGEKYFGSPQLLPELKKTSNFLPPGETVSFRHVMRNCPREVVSEIREQTAFAKDEKGDIRMEYEIKGLSVI